MCAISVNLPVYRAKRQKVVTKGDWRVTKGDWSHIASSVPGTNGFTVAGFRGWHRPRPRSTSSLVPRDGKVTREVCENIFSFSLALEEPCTCRINHVSRRLRLQVRLLNLLFVYLRDSKGLAGRRTTTSRRTLTSSVLCFSKGFQSVLQ